jgi:hypothetical protein
MKLSFTIKTHHLVDGEPLCKVFRHRSNVLDGRENPTCANCRKLLASDAHRDREYMRMRDLLDKPNDFGGPSDVA